MASPGTTDGVAHSVEIVGALVITAAIMPVSDVGRSARFVNVLFGAWFIAAPWLLGGGTIAAVWNDVAIGIALILLSLPRGRVRVHYGNWDRFIR